MRRSVATRPTQAGPHDSATSVAQSGSQQSRLEGCWSCLDTAPRSTSPTVLSRPDAESTAGMDTPCTMTGMWIAWWVAIISAAEVPGNLAVANALAAAIANQEIRKHAVARKRKQEEEEAARRLEEDALVSLLEVELRALCATDPGMSLLTAVEFVTHDPAHRIGLYRRCGAEDKSISGMSQDDLRFSKMASSVASDLAFERRARAEGFRV
jgi:hypothetical protein